MQTFLLG